MEPVTMTLGAKLAEISVRTTADGVATRIQRARADRDKNATIAQLDEIITDLQRDRADLILLAQGLEEQFVAQKLTTDEIGFISEQVIPLIERFAGEDKDEVLEGAKELLSVELLTIMQTIGFNYRRALGEPLTEIVRMQLLARLGPWVAASAEGEGPSVDAPE